MTTVSSHALQPGGEKAIKVARSWSLRALQAADSALKEGSGREGGICEQAKVVGLYNLGMMAEVCHVA